jgi:hypothetical protein
MPVHLHVQAYLLTLFVAASRCSRRHPPESASFTI